MATSFDSVDIHIECEVMSTLADGGEIILSTKQPDSMILKKFYSSISPHGFANRK